MIKNAKKIFEHFGTLGTYLKCRFACTKGKHHYVATHLLGHPDISWMECRHCGRMDEGTLTLSYNDGKKLKL
jgi:hypothetical protein